MALAWFFLLGLLFLLLAIGAVFGLIVILSECLGSESYVVSESEHFMTDSHNGNLN